MSSITQGSGEDRTHRQRPQFGHAAREVTIPADTLVACTDLVVTGLFGVMLELDALQGLVGDGPAGERLAQCARRIEDLVIEVRAVIVDAPVPREEH
ncbi:hypothetical protein [Nocardioides nematodiphilus]|uniref:hypothetical protein n=1 Tax=Nocardioides nematodiphilus TaxID=2849669 RepID=UPI001CDA213E|nr:hypothetical protein [Nocardioides nematodiphilus]MCA1984740.1 hypothetical protein [Nocardioides nematodiphilus]